MAQVVIAVRGGMQAKSRLSAALSPAARAGLALAMLQDMLRATAEAPSVAVWVVTPTREVADLAAGAGARVLLQPAGEDLNAAFRRGLEAAAEAAPFDAVVLLPGDLPQLEPGDLQAAIALAEANAVVLAPARRGGTAAVVLRAGEPFTPMFGPDSFQRHRAQAAASGRRVAVLNAASLGDDVDEPEDLRALAGADRAAATRTCLSSYFAKGDAHVPASS